MSDGPDITRQLRRELDETRLRLAEAEETLDAIRQGEADGFVIAGPQGPQVFTLQGALEPYRLLIEQMSDGALTLSRDGVILYANQAFATMLQLPPGRVIGTALRDFLPAADQPALAGLIATALNGSSSGEVSLRAAAGSTVTLRLGLHRLQLGAETLICAVATDITVEKQREIELRRLAELFEAGVAERTADLAASRVAALNMMEEAVEARKAVEEANRGLTLEITARKRAEDEVGRLNASLEQRVLDRTAELEAANREMEAFSYSVSHDLRTPLRAMDGFSLALAEDYAGQLDERAQNYLQFIRTGSQRMAELIDDLLNLSRLSREAMHRERVDLTAMAQEVGARLQHANPGRTVELVVAPSLTADADARMLQVVLSNLLGNAWKFTGKREGAKIEMGTTTSPEPSTLNPQLLPSSCATTGPGSTWRMRTNSSARSSACTAPRSSRAAGSGWPWCSGSFDGTTAACGPRAPSAGAPRFISSWGQRLKAKGCQAEGWQKTHARSHNTQGV
jgi:PAS domain S-box-containing protein